MDQPFQIFSWVDWARTAWFLGFGIYVGLALRAIEDRKKQRRFTTVGIAMSLVLVGLMLLSDMA